MTSLLYSVKNYYDYLWSLADPRVEDLPLMSSPIYTMAICLAYVYCVTRLGPKLMENRKPFEIRGLMIAYNFIMVVVSSSIVYFGSAYAWFDEYSFACQPVDYSNSIQAIVALRISYVYYLTKYVEFLDTVFFILRKKYNQVSTLHVIHHGILPFSVWWGVKFVPGGHATFFGYINSIVHVVMYLYYGLAAIGPQMRPYLFWKKYLTAFQMIQFVMIFGHSFQLLFRNDCNFPKIFVVWIGAHGVLFWFLFSDFYKKTYRKSDGKVQVSSAVRSDCNNNAKQQQEKSDDNKPVTVENELRRRTSPEEEAEQQITTKRNDKTFFACAPLDDLIKMMNYEKLAQS